MREKLYCYRFSFHQIAISNNPELTNFYTLDISTLKKTSIAKDYLENWMNGISSFNKKYLSSQINQNLHKFIKKIEVTSITLDSFIKNTFFFNPDFLHIDT